MNAFDQQLHTARILSHADITIDEIWSRYVSLGGSADAVGLTAYLHGTLLLSTLQQDLVTYAVNDLLTKSHGCPADASCPLTAGTVAQQTHQTVGPLSSTANPERLGDSVAGASATSPCTPAGDTLIADPPRTGPEPVTSWPSLRIRLSSMFDPAKAEQRRLAALQRTGLMRTGSEERFDRFTREARDRFGVTTAAITLITDTEQIVKSAAGPLAANLPRNLSFCTHTITEDRALILADATLEDQFSNNPLVTGSPHVRFYAGYPLTGPDGWRIGALCLLDTEPRAFDENDRKNLIDLAHRIEAEILQR